MDATAAGATGVIAAEIARICSTAEPSPAQFMSSVVVVEGEGDALLDMARQTLVVFSNVTWRRPASTSVPAAAAAAAQPAAAPAP
jgi:hypothetical protein